MFQIRKEGRCIYCSLLDQLANCFTINLIHKFQSGRKDGAVMILLLAQVTTSFSMSPLYVRNAQEGYTRIKVRQQATEGTCYALSSLLRIYQIRTVCGTGMEPCGACHVSVYIRYAVNGLQLYTWNASMVCGGWVGRRRHVNESISAGDIRHTRSHDSVHKHTCNTHARAQHRPTPIVKRFTASAN